jgi:lysophospholipase L1-like esterase
MIRRFTFLALTSLLSVLPLHAETVVPAQTETDKRLPPKGGSWRLDEATVTNESLPRVLLIGDSITNGYMAGVRKNLGGKANIDAWITPTTQADKSLPKTLEAILSQHKYAVIHFNLGLHGWQQTPTPRIPQGQYEPLTKQLVENLKKDAPRAKLIWATITPVTLKDHPEQLNPDIQPIIEQHNAMALKVMKEENVAIDDLSSLMLPNLKMAAGDMFHWKAEGRELLVKAVTESIAHALPAS